MKRAIITGVTGQDGSYLAELLLEKGYEVHGVVRRASTETFDRIAHLGDRVRLHQADLLDQLSLIEVLREVRPQEVYNLAAMSFVPTSWKQPVLTGEFTGIGVTRVLEAIRLLDPKGIRFYQASSSEMFGKVRETPQSETTPFYPRCPYGVAKVYGHLHHGELPRKLRHVLLLRHPLQPRVAAARPRLRNAQDHATAAARIKLGLAKKLRLGNLEARRDWGYAGDYVEAMWRMLQQDRARRLRHRHRPDAQRRRAGGGGVRPRRPRLAQVCRTGPVAGASSRGGPADRRRDQGPARAGLASRRGLR